MKLIINIGTIIAFVFLLTTCREAKERIWYSEEANIKLKVCINDSCDVFVINDLDSIYTKHNKIYYGGYLISIKNESDSLLFVHRANHILKVKQNKFKISVYEPDTVNYNFEPEKKIFTDGITIMGMENGHFILFSNGEYVGEIPLVSMKY